MTPLEPRPRLVQLRDDLTVIVGAVAFACLVLAAVDFFAPARQVPPAPQSAPLLTPSAPALRLGPGVVCYDLPDGIMCTCDHAVAPR